VHLQPLFAYIDPMSGTIVLQVVVAAVIGCLTLFRKSFAAGFSLLTGRRPKASAETPSDETADSRRKAA
jgi:hypothetical protein